MDEERGGCLKHMTRDDRRARLQYTIVLHLPWLCRRPDQKSPVSAAAAQRLSAPPPLRSVRYSSLPALGSADKPHLESTTPHKSAIQHWPSYIVIIIVLLLVWFYRDKWTFNYEAGGGGGG